MADEPRHFKECVRFFAFIRDKNPNIVTSSLVLAEIQWTLTKFYKLSKIESIKALYGVMGLKNIKIVDNHDVLSAIKIYQNHSVKFVDAMIATNAEVKSGAIIVSYDKDFDKIGIKRIEPSEFND